MRSILVLVFIFCYSCLYCQTPERADYVWMTGGRGFYSSKQSGGLSYHMSLNWLQIIPNPDTNGIHYKKYYMKIRLINNMGSAGEDYYQNFWEIGYLYGISFGKSIKMTMAGGLGIVKGFESISDPITGKHINEDPYFFKLGIPVELGLDLAPLKYLGCGICVYADFNSRFTFYGIGIHLVLGKIR
jgi:hypothetical protein